MHWQNHPIPDDPYGNPMFRGLLVLTNDKNELLAEIMWFYDSGPYYAYAMDANDTSMIRRLGACTSIEGAKRSVDKALLGEINISSHTAYSRL